ncbi:MAG: hypothetical protein A7315_08840 [Candidatus Altiarchaeales archaeon WOR_SM1_79]|nr:MAG: hypothetical protein A7315_08840 [Candidatus Altiarchaeales archaeon WOR_SM1_79]
MIDIISEKEIKKWKCVYKECEALCCAHPPLITIGSIRRISDATKLKPEEFVHLSEDKPGLFRLKTREKDGKCFFSNDDHSCELHKIDKHPLFCRMLPFKFDGLTYGDEIILRLKAIQECPGYGKGGDFDDEAKTEIEKWAARFARELENYVRLKHKGLSFNEIFNKNWREIE